MEGRLYGDMSEFDGLHGVCVGLLPVSASSVGTLDRLLDAGHVGPVTV